MVKCKLCGNKTAKGRQTCKGCQALKRTAKSKDKTPMNIFKIANDHLDKNPGLINISWKSFWKKNNNIIV